MSGRIDLEKKIKSRIDNILKRNGNYLTGYYNFIGMNKSLGTKYNYICNVESFMKDCGKTIDELTMDDFAKYISNIYETKSSSYAITVHAALKHFGKYLFASNKLKSNPMEYVERPKYKETPEMLKKRDLSVLEKNEIKKINLAVKNGAGNNNAKIRQEKYRNRDRLIINLLFSTGIRCSALVSIDVSDIDFDNKTLIVYEKGNKIHTSDLSQQLVDNIKCWLDDRNIILNGKKENALFISNRLTRISQNSVSVIVKKYSESVAGKTVSPHKLRATFGTQVYAVTKDIYFTQEQMGHSSPKTTERYIRGREKRYINSADIMSKLIL